MKQIPILAACALTLTGCMSEPSGSSQTAEATSAFAPVTTRAGFVSNVAGRNIAEGDGFFVMQSDGTMNGVDAEGNAYTGVWSWENGAWCRAFDREAGRTQSKCRTIAVNEDQIRFIKVENGEQQFYDWQ